MKKDQRGKEEGEKKIKRGGEKGCQCRPKSCCSTHPTKKRIERKKKEKEGKKKKGKGGVLLYEKSIAGEWKEEGEKRRKKKPRPPSWR